MAKLQPVRGTHDLLGEDARRHRHVVETALATAARYGFSEIQTPIFEFTEVFARTLGETSDVVSKEMYSFTDRGGETITLRPEGTAGVARALISGGLTQDLPLKLFYQGPMFRYERPQKGRQRQFHQIGVELLGVPAPQADIEVITVGADILDALGIFDGVVLELNTLGDTESREAYRTALVDYLIGHKDGLSEDSLRRLEVNPLRILDSKDEGDRAIVANAPSFGDYLNAASQDFYGTVKAGLEAVGVPYRQNDRLVRGLDYYCHTAYEFVTDRLGAQGTVMAGGRYDGLVEMMGGPSTPGVGWAAGIERIAMMIEAPAAPARPVAVIPVGEEAAIAAIKLSHDLRKAGIAVEMGYSGNLGKRMKRANKLGASHAVILGETELENGVATVRDLDSGTQTEIALGKIGDHLKAEV
ncbi:MAG: histidine--tRNA ligase [Nisaea sp.]|jgi:histidyl-tRNA synthetase|uniref:histidine--tRNA ligase n=1 Tax=Nisaea sp. TaxID=2024842 RepID=UPI001B207D0D|nr:histidine--tRNA ligase [Nisaea sp.]MBO6559376.1 histidine--tRNA ligase [Nisaea sp.]